ncbi:MAG: hypothetical protein A3F73_06135 [Gallionellales bacterium RIFCSPLOWO2_12_FULL_59_22]|nr:MAG: hypothetical protein A3H99_03295 [Gallionellales bacterium RIFCSPLOWO2_02_FULL_59_110]OGT03679.1 MAG: hypothetical protein A2Z65_02460 [Gallionellales bacterium RIFCSPLOWO2_02_58_13]OGT11021.1 MAG: hypothetical protein A3F73_06135 [Gallionellales bacterium RIFCSPLOWO2_12_FULL_59_22]
MEPQSLAANRGWQWIKQGYVLFMKAPLLWVVILLICLAAATALSAVPVVGEPLASLLLPVLLAGLMAGCRALEQGDELELAHLFGGFQKHATRLIALGGIALVGQFMIFGAMIMVGGTTLVGILTSGQPVEDPEIMRQAITEAPVAVLLGMALFSVLTMAMQFAPMLVYFNNATPAAAMKLSLRAFLVNIGPMLVYGATFMVLAILATIPMMLGWLVLMPIIFTSLYACYCDIFPVAKEVAPPPVENDAFTPDRDAF